MRKIALGLIFGVATMFSAAGWCQQTVVSPFPPNSVLAAGQGGTQLDPTAQAANYALVTTGNPQTPYAFVLLPAVPGSVTTVSCATANGFACTVATPTTTPVLTLKTTITGILKGNGTAASAAVAGTDYAAATSGSAVLKGNGAGGFANALNSDLPAMSATVGGAVPTPPNNTTTFLRGDGTFAAPIGAPITVVTTSPVTPASATPVSSGLSVTLTSSATYLFEIHYYVQPSATANTTISLNFGSVTATSINGSLVQFGTPALGQTGITQITALTTTLNSGSVGSSFIEQIAIGTMVVNAGGTFIPGYATAATSTDSLLVGSWMRLTRIN
jgi:hypothetical protein